MSVKLAPTDSSWVGEVLHRLHRLGGDATFDDLAVGHAALTGHDDEVAGANDGAVRTEWLAHGRRRYRAHRRRSRSTVDELTA